MTTTMWLDMLIITFGLMVILRPLRRTVFGNGRASFTLPAFLGAMVGCLLTECTLNQVQESPAGMGWLVPFNMFVGALMLGKRGHRWIRGLDE